jgi:hypothetical protein
MTEQEIGDAVAWALTQTWVDPESAQEIQVTAGTPHALVCTVREYFNLPGIVYGNFDYEALKAYLD